MKNSEKTFRYIALRFEFRTGMNQILAVLYDASSFLGKFFNFQDSTQL